MAESWEVVYDRIRRDFECGVGDWVDDMARDLDAIEAAPETPGGLAALFRRLHDLAGSSGTYGLSGVSSRASEAVMVCRSALDRNAALTTGEVERVRELLKAMRDEMKTVPGNTPRREPVDPGNENSNERT